MESDRNEMLKRIFQQMRTDRQQRYTMTYYIIMFMWIALSESFCENLFQVANKKICKSALDLL